MVGVDYQVHLVQQNDKRAFLYTLLKQAEKTD
jgi:hypothetical protein